MRNHTTNGGEQAQQTANRPKANASGTVELCNKQVQCHVLSDGRRVLDTSQIQAMFGASKNRMFRRMLSRIPSLPEQLAVHPSIAFTLKDGGVAYGYEAGFVMDVCLAYQKAFLANQLHHAQLEIAREAMGLVAAYAKVGLEAVIDEATGHQRLRPGDFLRRRVAEILREEKDTWKDRWTDDIAEAFCRLYGHPSCGKSSPAFMRSIVGRIYDLVIGRAEMTTLRRRNPNPSKGTNHHQFFVAEVQTALEQELKVIAALAETSTSKQRFWRAMHTRYLNDPLQLDLYN